MDPFAVLGIERRFDVDVAAVEKTHRELSRTLHPDKYVGAGASERRYALSKAVEVNEAWRVVRDPIRRAEALFTLAGVAVGETNEPKPGAALLMEVMEQREQLAEARDRRDAVAVQALAKGILALSERAERSLTEGFLDAKGEAAALAPLVPKLGELRFWRRFLDEVSAIQDDLEEAAAARPAP